MARKLQNFFNCFNTSVNYRNCTFLSIITNSFENGRTLRQPSVRAYSSGIKFAGGPSLEQFLPNNSKSKYEKIVPSKAETYTYLSAEDCAGDGSKVHFLVYGCQMNINDLEIVRAIMLLNGYIETDTLQEADVVMIMTCSVRESAENKIWQTLKYIKGVNRGRTLVCVLGCMAERLKHTLFTKDRLVHVISGPDSYRDLPRLLAVAKLGEQAMNVQLSLEETYADIVPVRAAISSKTAFVSIMRGCNNMCTYCIVPFTRGRERSRPIQSILDEVKRLSDEGYKQIILLGQNVNSYNDLSEISFTSVASAEFDLPVGFSHLSRRKQVGKTFMTLLDEISKINEEMRIRFTSPHPKDFPLQLIQLISERNNLCKGLHLPAQSGSNSVLEKMGRGYTVEAYLQLVTDIRKIMPGVNFTSDFIAGFCGETEDDHKKSLQLIKDVGYSFCYVFPYSMREKTRAYRRFQDDVAPEVKHRRHLELAATFREEAGKFNESLVGSTQLVLVEGESKRSSKVMAGRVDGGTKTMVESGGISEKDVATTLNAGDYVTVKITSASSQTLKGQFVEKTTLSDFYKKYGATYGTTM